jgi:hypothetical protein
MAGAEIEGKWGEAERAEREERRGLEARGGVLLAAGAGIVGLLATALPNANVTGSERDAVLITFAFGVSVMLASLLIVAVVMSWGALKLKGIRAAPPEEAAGKIRESNEDLVRGLGIATVTFAVAIAVFLVALVWAAFASAPPARQKTPIACVTFVREVDELVDDESPAVAQAAMSKDSRSSACAPVSLPDLRRR